MEPRTINNHSLSKWKNLNVFSGWRSLLSFSEPLYLAAQIQFKNWRMKDALQTSLDFLVACLILLQVSATEAWTNKRFRVGVIVGLVALPAWRSHLFFDINVRMDDFYYVNYAFYFNTIRAYMCGILVATGAFIAMPQKWAFRWWALPVVVFCSTEIYAESYYTHWTDFYQAMPGWQVWLIIVSSVVPAYLSLNYLAYRKYHLKDGTAARIVGVMRTKGIPIEQKMDLMEKLALEAETYNERI